MRFTHTGEAGGIPGETLAAIASLGGALLVWTGISMALHRLRSRNQRKDAVSTTTEAQASTTVV
jgi:threonine/homoserine/homoserine lactone efflux protein